jgi:hypothetical protein
LNINLLEFFGAQTVISKGGRKSGLLLLAGDFGFSFWRING